MRNIGLTILLLSLSNIFMTFAWYAHLKELNYYLKEPLKLDYLWAALCILGAVYFVFRSRLAGV
jgi:uncharacterized protein (DUF486 family)